MNKIFKFGLAFFAMLLVSAACFADVSWKDKRCEGAWVREDDPNRGYYFNKGKIYRIIDGMWFEDVLLENDPGFDDEYCIRSHFDWYTIKSVNGNTMKILEEHVEWEKVVTYKKLSKIPPKSKQSWEEYWRNQ